MKDWRKGDGAVYTGLLLVWLLIVWVLLHL